MASMHVVERGSGLVHIWLHCMFGCSRSLQAMSQGLAGRHIFPDARSHGLSPRGYDITIESMADDTLRILDERKVEKAVIVGHSMGGKVAMCAVSRQPGRFSKVVVLDVAPIDYGKVIPETAGEIYKGVRLT